MRGKRFILIREIDTRNKQEARQLLNLPFKVYKDCKQRVPPLDIDARSMLDWERHPFYKTSEAAFFMVFSDGGVPSGRIAVLDNTS